MHDHSTHFITLYHIFSQISASNFHKGSAFDGAEAVAASALGMLKEAQCGCTDDMAIEKEHIVDMSDECLPPFGKRGQMNNLGDQSHSGLRLSTAM